MARAALPIEPSISRKGDSPWRLTRPTAASVAAIIRLRIAAGHMPHRKNRDEQARHNADAERKRHRPQVERDFVDARQIDRCGPNEQA